MGFTWRLPSIFTSEDLTVWFLVFLLSLLSFTATFAGDLPPVAKGTKVDSYLWRQSTEWQVRQVAISPDGTLAAYSLFNRGLFLCDAATGIMKHRLLDVEHYSDIIEFSDKGSLLLANDSTTLLLWNTKTGEQVQKFDVLKALQLGPQQTPSLHAGAISADGKYVSAFLFIVGGAKGWLITWDVSTGKAVCSSRQTFASLPAAFDLNRDGTLFCAGCTESLQLIAGNARTGTSLCPPLKGVEIGKSAAFSEDGKTVLGVFNYRNTTDKTPWMNEVFVRMDPHSGKLLSRVPLDGVHMFKLMEKNILVPKVWAFSGDGRKAITCLGNQLKVWNTATGNVERTGSGFDSICVDFIAASRDGSRVITSGVNMTGNNVYFWKLAP